VSIDQPSSFGQLERSLSPISSVRVVREICERCGLTISLRTVGNKLKTVACHLVDKKGRVATGKGKGIGLQSVASAIFEALEYFHYGTEHVDRQTPIPLNLKEWDRELIDGSPDFEFICGSKPLPLTRLQFTKIDRDTPDLLLPAFLTNPYYQASDETEQRALSEHRLLRYATNSGTAAGLTNADAILHGLLETIERDAIGVELLRVIIRKTPFPVRNIRLDSLPSKLHELSHDVAVEAACNIDIWDITNNLDVPVILVV
jgi:ribosomal protein S12 methylthiotransferase accessory factor